MTKQGSSGPEAIEPKARKRKPIELNDWRIEESAFGQTVVIGEDAEGRRRTASLWWWSDFRFGTDGGVFKEGQPAKGQALCTRLFD